MSHIWRKPLTAVAGVAAVVGMMGLSSATAGAAVHHHPSLIIISDYQFVDQLNPFQNGTVFDTEVTGISQPSGNLSLWEPNTTYKFLESSQPKSNKAGTKWTFKLHSGMKWSNGDPITNADYKFAWNVQSNKNTGACAGTCDDIKGIKLVGKLGLTVTLKKAESTALFNVLGAVVLLDHNWALNGNDGVKMKSLSSCLKSQSGCNTVAKAYEDPGFNYNNKSYVTAGPFQVASWDPISGIVDMTPNHKYTSSMPGGKPTIAEIKYVPYGAGSGDSSQLIAAAATGQTDATEDYSLLDVGNSSTSGSLEYYSSQSHPPFQTYVAANADPELYFYNSYNPTVTVDNSSGGSYGTFSNPFYGTNGTKVRLALGLAFNRSEIISNTFDVSSSVSDGLVSYCAPILCTAGGGGEFNDYHSITGAWDPIANAYEPGKCATDGSSNTSIQDALTLLGQAGYGPSNHLNIYLVSTTKAYRVNERAYLQSCWDALASWVNVTSYAIPSTVLYTDYQSGGTYANGHYEAGIIGYSGGPDPDGWKGSLLSVDCPQTGQHTAAQGNYACVTNSALDAAFNAGGAALSNSARQADYNTVQSIMAKNAYWEIDAPLPSIWTSDNKMSGFQMDTWVAPMSWNTFHWS